MAKRGRPQVNIDKNQFEKLCAMWCTLEDVTGFFECSEETVRRFCKREYKDTFDHVSKQFAGKGRISLRKNQLELSKKNAAMAIFLGKNYLGQSDNPEDNIDVEDSDSYFHEAGL